MDAGGEVGEPRGHSAERGPEQDGERPGKSGLLPLGDDPAQPIHDEGEAVSHREDGVGAMNKT